MAASLVELQSILNSCFLNQELNLQVNHTGSNLSVMINRSANQAMTNYNEIAETLMEKLRSLNLSSVTSVKLYGRTANTKQIEWQASYPLKALTTKASSTSLSNSSGNRSENRKEKGLTSQKAKSKFQEYLQQFSHYSNVISAASLIGMLLVLGFNTLAGQKTQTIKYEYMVQSVSDLAFTESMNTIGSQGWELVVARRAQDSVTEKFEYECIFKRPKK